MRAIKLVDNDRAKSGKNEDVKKSIRREAPSKLVKDRVEDNSDEEDDDDWSKGIVLIAAPTLYMWKYFSNLIIRISKKLYVKP